MSRLPPAVMVPEFLTAEWNREEFPRNHNPFLLNDPVDITPCLKPWSFAEWAKQWRVASWSEQPSWVVPDPIFELCSPALVEYPPASADRFYRQQVLSNMPNLLEDNPFTAPLKDDLVLHSKMTIPLVPTGQAFDINVKYLTEVIFEPRCQYFAFTLMDEEEGRKMRLEVTVLDQCISVNVMVNNRRMNHTFNESRFSKGDAKNGWWDMDN